MSTNAYALIEQGKATVAENLALLPRFAEMAGQFSVNLVVAGLILAVTLVAANWFARAVRRGLARLKSTSEDVLLQTFGGQVARWAVIVIGVVAALSRLGVEAASILAVLGAASLAIGLAMQGALSNVAAGVLLLIIRPYRAGDFVEIAGRMGTVRRLDLFTTQLATPDNLKVVVPNSKVLSDLLVNYSTLGTRRLDLSFDVHYDTPLDKALALVKATAAADPRALADPPPWAGLRDLKDSGMLIRLHVWVRSEDWLEARSSVLKAVREAFTREGVEIPYPHQVHIEGKHG